MIIKRQWEIANQAIFIVRCYYECLCRMAEMFCYCYFSFHFSSSVQFAVQLWFIKLWHALCLSLSLVLLLVLLCFQTISIDLSTRQGDIFYNLFLLFLFFSNLFFFSHYANQIEKKSPVQIKRHIHSHELTLKQRLWLVIASLFVSCLFFVFRCCFSTFLFFSLYLRSHRLWNCCSGEWCKRARAWFPQKYVITYSSDSLCMLDHGGYNRATVHWHVKTTSEWRVATTTKKTKRNKWKWKSQVAQFVHNASKSFGKL